MNIRQQIKAIFMGNAPFTVSLMGVLLVLLIMPIYLSGNMASFNHSFQDRLFKAQFSQPQPHPDIVLVAVSDQTISQLGWPLPRQLYTQLLERLKAEQVKAIGFNILLSTPNQREPEVDKKLAETFARTPNVVMPFFYDYADGSAYLPLDLMSKQVKSLGNVSVYPGDVSHYIEAELFNQSVSPRQVMFPMGVELARLYLNLPTQSLQVSQHKLQVDQAAALYLEENGLEADLIRINYIGGPNFYPRVALEEILAGKHSGLFKDKLVLVGAFTPTLGGTTTSPYGDQTSAPIYSTEIQALIAQMVLDDSSLFRIPPTWLMYILLLIGVVSGLVLTRYSLVQQVILLVSLVLASCLIAFLSFNVLGWILDIAPFVSFFGLMAIGQITLLNLRSYLAINDQIAKLQDYEQKLPEVPAGRRLENILTSLFYISQADWVAYRRLDLDQRNLQLHDVKSRVSDHVDDDDEPVPLYPFSDLPPYYPVEPIQRISSQRIIPLEYQQLPLAIKEAYQQYPNGYYVIMPVFNQKKELMGVFELYYRHVSGSDEIQTSLLEELRDVAAESMIKFNPKHKRSRDFVPGVEQKIKAMDRLMSMRETETAFFSTVLESTTNPVVVCDQIGEIRFYNDNFLHLLHLETHADITSANIQELMSRVFQILPQQWQDIWMTTLQRRKLKEVQVNTERGVYHLTLTPVFGKHSEVTGVVIILTDVTKLHRQANYDKLTGLYNRRYFDELIMKEFQRCQRNPNQPFSLLMMDVDHFKRFNDTYGHQVGDQVLASFGQVLSKVVRRTDMPIRYGGEEMAVILPNTPADQAAIAAEKIRTAIETLQLYDLEGKAIQKITASIGVAEFDPADTKPDEILRRADDALYKSKDAGRNCIHVHHGDTRIDKYIHRS